MILHGNQRGGGLQLARHLTNVIDNEHVTIHEIRGFGADTLAGAFQEAHAISKGTACQQFLFSLSLNPPPDASVPNALFIQTINEAEERLGLANQPRAIVYHEKHGRRHAHAVWLRVDIEKMKGINLAFTKKRLRQLSKEIFYEQDWKMPCGLMDSAERNPLNFSHAEYQQALRQKLDTRSIKTIFQECWAVSDSAGSYSAALEERGFYLAQGRRGFVAVDWRGEIYALRQWTSQRSKELKSKLGNPNNFPSVQEVKFRLAESLTPKLRSFADELIEKHATSNSAFARKKDVLVKRQREERDKLAKEHEIRRISETKQRASRLPTGIKALWFRVTGKYKSIRQENETQAELYRMRDEAELQSLVQSHIAESRDLHRQIRQMRHHHVTEMRKLNVEMGAYIAAANDSDMTVKIAMGRKTKQRRRRPARSRGLR